MRDEDIVQFSEKEVHIMIESMRVRGELKIKSEEELRDLCRLLTREELIDVFVRYWKIKKKENSH